MNLLIDNAPDYIVIGGKKIKINTSFSAWVKFVIASKKDDIEMVFRALMDIFDELPNEPPDKVLKACMDWMFCTEKNEVQQKEAPKRKSSSEAYDFEVDGNVIYCELWEYFPQLMQRGITYHEGIELIKILLQKDKTLLSERAFARCGDFSKLDKEHKKMWQKRRAMWAIPNTSQKSIDDVFSNAF